MKKIIIEERTKKIMENRRKKGKKITEKYKKFNKSKKEGEKDFFLKKIVDENEEEN